MPILLQWRSACPAGSLKTRLMAGDRKFGLYGLRSFVILNQRVQALLEPRSDLRNILAALQVKRSSNRWVTPALSPCVIRLMEHRPVRAGLAARPEQWQWSSAWDD